MRAEERGVSIEQTGMPAAGPAPRRAYGRLVAGGFLGALVVSGIAVLLALRFAEPDIPADAGGAEPQPAETTPALADVAGLEVDRGSWSGDPGSWEIALSWDPVQGADHYVVSRDGRSLDEVTETSFTDGGVTPEATYSYEVVAVDASGTESKPAKVRAQTGKLPDAEARVEGKWVLALKIESSSVGAGGGKIIVTFDPTCKDGPCDVRWSISKAANTGTAKAKGASYRGDGSGALFTRDCRGNPVGSTQVTFSFKVNEAHIVGNAWRATEVSGTLTESVPAVTGCLSARNVWSFEGTAQG